MSQSPERWSSVTHPSVGGQQPSLLLEQAEWGLGHLRTEGHGEHGPSDAVGGDSEPWRSSAQSCTQTHQTSQPCLCCYGLTPAGQAAVKQSEDTSQQPDLEASMGLQRLSLSLSLPTCKWGRQHLQ